MAIVGPQQPLDSRQFEIAHVSYCYQIRQLNIADAVNDERPIIMTVRALDKLEWKAYFDHLSKNLIGERAEIEIVGLALGDRIEARWVPLIGITYESKGDILEIALEGLDHLIHRPRGI